MHSLTARALLNMFAAMLPQNSAAAASLSETLRPASPSAKSPWAEVRRRVEEELGSLLRTEDEASLHPYWNEARAQIREYILRPAKRIRPLFLVAGYGLGMGRWEWPAGLVRFAAASELLHGFMLVHDDIADRAESRRGGPSLHRMLGEEHLGEDLAVVAGDHLYARAIEAMLRSGFAEAPRAVTYYLGICRHTAVGQYLDLKMAQVPLQEVTLKAVLKVALHKTAKYGFIAPLCSGAILAGAPNALLSNLSRVGRLAGVAFQLRDDLIGLFGDQGLSGKSDGADFYQAKRTFPLIAAHARAPTMVRRELRALWSLREENPAALERGRELVDLHGGRQACERAIGRLTRSARRAMRSLPPADGVREGIDLVLQGLERRDA